MHLIGSTTGKRMNIEILICLILSIVNKHTFPLITFYLRLLNVSPLWHYIIYVILMFSDIVNNFLILTLFTHLSKNLNSR